MCPGLRGDCRYPATPMPTPNSTQSGPVASEHCPPPAALADNAGAAARAAARVHIRAVRRGAEPRSGARRCQMRRTSAVPWKSLLAAVWSLSRRAEWPTCDCRAVPTPGSDTRRHLLLAAALHRGRNAQRLAIFGDGAAGDVDAVALQVFDELVVGQHRLRHFRVDELADAVAHGFGGMRLAHAVWRRRWPR